MSDRVFTVAFSVSLGIHLIFLVGQLLSIDWFRLVKTPRPIQVVYETPPALRELQHLQERHSRAKRETVAPPSANPLEEHQQIRIPDRPSLTANRSMTDLIPERSSVVDLTNLVDAARGNPVLLSYFSAIREQIQQTANRQAWLTGTSTEGLVYVTFILSATGAIREVQIVTNRSAASAALRDVAVQIVKTAAPFPPFPPSVTEATKTIVVPLEFLLGT
jgi:protein TonB